MASRRGDAKAQIEQWAKLFEPYVNKNMTLSFGKFNFPDVFISKVEIANTTGMVNAPDKRMDGDKAYTPAVMQIVTNAGILRFIVESTVVVAITNGLRLITGVNKVDLRITDANNNRH